jgi:uncharacterized protein (TIGR02246 family)
VAGIAMKMVLNIGVSLAWTGIKAHTGTARQDGAVRAWRRPPIPRGTRTPTSSPSAAWSRAGRSAAAGPHRVLDADRPAALGPWPAPPAVRHSGLPEVHMSRLVTLAALLLLALSATPVLAQDDAGEAEIRAIVAAQVRAWNAGDGTAFAKDIAPEVSFTNLFGMVMYGAPTFAERQRQILATFYKGTTKHHVVRRIRFVTAEVAIVDIDNEVRGVKAMPAGIAVPSDGVVRTQLMQVFVRRGGRWWIEAFHNVDVKSPN